MLEYGPTETVNFLRCPALRYFEKHWEPREKWKPHKAIGSAMSAAIHASFTCKGEPLVAAGEAIKRTLDAEFDEEQEEWTKEALVSLVQKGFEAAAKTTLRDILEVEDYVASELTIGHGRIDLVTRFRATEELVITDHKTSLLLKPEWVNPRLLETEIDWQLRDYAWRASQYYNEPVTAVRRHLIVLAPRPKTYAHTVTLSKEVLEQWVKSAEVYWGQIEAVSLFSFNQLPQRLPECIGRYGKCPAYDACHVLLRDENKMEGLYRRKNEKTKERD